MGADKTNETDSSVTDNYGHGTHVAGIAAAETNNGTGIAGIAGNCKVLVVQVFDANGSGTPQYFYNGVHYAVDYVRNHSGYVMVINYSGGGSSPSSVEESAVSYANTYGVTIVASAGNDYGGSVLYPAAYSSSYSNVIAVSATDQNDVVASYSNAGSQINVSSPGGWGVYQDGSVQRYNGTNNLGRNIFSTEPNYSFNLQNGTDCAQNYGYLAGTSMAAPQVTGTVALILSVEPSLTPSQIRTTLQNSATKVAGMNGQNFTNQYGYGRLNANGAVRNLYVPDVYPTIASANSAAINGQTISITSGTSSISSNTTLPSGVSLTVISGATVNLNGYQIVTTGGGVVTVNVGATINGVVLQGSNGGFFSSIQPAINAASSGQTVQLRAQAYSESPSFSSKSNITLTGQGQGSTTLSGSVSVTNSSYIFISGLTMSGYLYISNSSNTNVSGVAVTGTSMVADYAGTNSAIGSMSASNIGASQGVYSYGGTGNIFSCSISNGDCGVMLVNNASYNVGTGNIFCGNGYDISATGGGYAYAISNTYSRALPGAVYGNVFITGINNTCGPMCGLEDDLFEATEGASYFDDLNGQYLALLWKTNTDKASGTYSTQNYVPEYTALLDAYKNLVKPGFDKSIIIAALSKIGHLYKDLGNKADLTAYVRATLQAGTLKIVEPYLQRFLIWNYVDDKQFEQAIKLADTISSSSTADRDLIAEMLYEKGLICKNYLNDPKRANEMFTALVASFPSSPLSKFASSTMSAESRSVINSNSAATVLASKKDAVEFLSYPNPFNPATVIRFSMPAEGQVRLRVFDILGKEVAMLLDGPLTAGAHQVKFDGSSLPSGVYICRLEVDGKSFIQRMVLLK